MVIYVFIKARQEAVAMPEILSYSFMQHALIATVLISICIGIVGTLVTVNRMVFLAGGIAHGSYGGIGIAIFFGFMPILGATLFAILLSIVIATVSYKNKEKIDPVIGAMWAAGMAIGIIFTDLTPGYNVDLMSYLFGSIISVSKSDLYIMTCFDLLILVLVSLFHKELLALSFDSEFAKLRGIKTKLLYYMLLIIIGFSIIVTIRAVGLILVIALMSIPTFIAEKFSNSLYKMMFISFLLTLTFSLCGLILSYYFDISSGATIILTASLFFFVFTAITTK
jgi:zinc transport system permease protein